MSQIDTKQGRKGGFWSALPSLMLGLGFALNLAWIALLAWGAFQLAEWVLS